MAKRPTQKDVAELAGVSISTVSRVLNENDTVNSNIAKKVRKAIDKLNYTPNSLAQGLRSDKSYTIGMIVPEITNPYTLDVAKAALKTLQKHGYEMYIEGTEYNIDIENKSLRNMMKKRVDGLLVTSIATISNTLEEIAEKVPIVQIDFINSQKIDSVRVDNLEGTFHAMGHLIVLGYKHVAIIAGPQEWTAGQERLKGYQQALSHYHLPFNQSLVKTGEFTIQSGYELCMELLNSGEEIDAIFAANNVIGVGCLKALSKKNIKIPDEIALCVFDDMPLADMVNPPLTVIEQPTNLIGRTAAEMLLDRINDTEINGIKEILLKPRLIRRSSA